MRSQKCFENSFLENGPFWKMAKTPTKKSKPINFYFAKCFLGYFLLILGADKKFEMRSGQGV